MQATQEPEPAAASDINPTEHDMQENIAPADEVAAPHDPQADLVKTAQRRRAKVCSMHRAQEDFDSTD